MAKDQDDKWREKALREQAIAIAARWKAWKESMRAHRLQQAIRDTNTVSVPSGSLNGVNRTAGAPTQPPTHQQIQHELELLQERYKKLETCLRSTPQKPMTSEELIVAFIERLQHNSRNPILLVISIDGYHNILAKLGYYQAEDLIRQIYGRLKERLQATDKMVVRCNRNEIVVVYGTELTGENLVSEATKLTREIGILFKEPFSLEGRPYTATASIGIITDHHPNTDPASLLLQGYELCYSIQRRGGNRAELPSHTTHRTATLANQIREAYDNNQFITLFEPTIKLTTGAIQGIWAHQVWNHPSLGLLTSQHYQEAAEKAGLVSYLQELLILQACWYFKKLNYPGRLFISLPAYSLFYEDFAIRIIHCIGNTQLSHQRIAIIITGSFEVLKPRVLELNFSQLSSAGISLGIDGFPLSLSVRYLKQFSDSYCLIPSSIIKKLPDGEPEATLAAGAIRTALRLQITPIAEDLENQEQIEYLALTGCDLGKGPLYDLPQFPEHLRHHPNKTWHY